MKINAHKLKVQNALLKWPELRDDDRRLMAFLWRAEIRKDGSYTQDQREAIEIFLRKFSTGKYSHGPTIKRVRAKLQEEFSILRGKKYYERKGILAQGVQEELGYGSGRGTV